MKYISSVSTPRYVHLSLTKSCNWRCVFCYQEHSEKLDFSKITEVIEKLIQGGISDITLYGGEITLLKDKWISLGRLIKEHDVNVSFITNGELLADVDSILLSSIQETFHGVSLSIHGVGAIHDLITKRKGSFNKTINALNKLYFTGIKIAVGITVCTYNLLYLSEILDFLITRFPGISLIINRAINHHSNNSVPPFLNRQEILRMLRIIDNFSSKHKAIDICGGVPIPPCILPDDLKKYGMYCSSGFDFAEVDAEGNIFLCPENTESLGNILHEDLNTIWNSKKLHDFRTFEWIDDRCKECDFLTDCWGGCKAGKSIDYIVNESLDEAFYILNPKVTTRSIDNYISMSILGKQSVILENEFNEIINHIKNPVKIESLINLGIKRNEITELVENNILIEIYREKYEYYNPDSI